MTEIILTASNARRVGQAEFTSAITRARAVDQTTWRGKLWTDFRTTYRTAEGGVIAVYSARLRRGTLRYHRAYLLPRTQGV